MQGPGSSGVPELNRAALDDIKSPDCGVGISNVNSEVSGRIRDQNFAAESREGGGRDWARALYLVPPAEEAGRIDVGVRLVFIVGHLNVVPHAVIHHLASVAQPALTVEAAAGATALASCPAEPRPAPSASARESNPARS